MRKELEVSGKTVDDALSRGAALLGVDARLLTYDVICAPKKGFLGFGETPATIKVYYEAGSEINALDFVRRLLTDMGIEAETSVKETGKDGGKLIDITGEAAGVLIGHHGETLDALQYLVNLVANKREEDEEGRSYSRISVDVENYRAKREETLRQLARRTASRVLKFKRNVTLEPMNPNERRIIHSEIQHISGVTTLSVGSDNNRRVVVYPADAPEPEEAESLPMQGQRQGAGQGQHRRRRHRNRNGQGAGYAAGDYRANEPSDAMESIAASAASEDCE